MITVLDNSLINKIAAGEVVERPASIVKELVENSIDANAKSITVEIKEGGISYIRVTDNGSGIPRESVKTAFLRHATSKISNEDDLINILTLGFRGEALSSIAAVSQVEMITKTHEDLAAKRLEIHGEEIVSEQEIGAVSGTSIIVRNIFFNVPARRKFLKKPSSESAYISEMMNRFALANPKIAFKFINSNSIMFETNGNGDLKPVILEIFGKDTAKSLIDLNYQKGYFKLNGFIGKPEISRSNRKYQNIFLNGRFIKNEIISSAAEEAFKTKLTIGKFPFFVININMPPDKVDVNVHPTKLEVRFEDEQLIYDTVFETVKNALNGEILIPDKKIEIAKKEIKKENAAEQIEINTNAEYNLKEPTVPYLVDIEEIISENTIFEDFVNEEIPKEKSIRENIPSVEEIKSRDLFFKDYKIVGQLFNTYWIIEQNDEIFYIDQHAAHERILYEKLINRLKNEKIDGQRLIQPIVFNISPTEINIINENSQILFDFGFDVEEFSLNSVAIRSIPYIFEKPEKANFFLDILDMLAKISSSKENIYDMKINNIAMISCKAAVKANNRLDFIEAKEIIRELLKLEEPFTCPHGRPTIIKISKYELEKQFKRIQ